jgi:hypothetical protein
MLYVTVRAHPNYDFAAGITLHESMWLPQDSTKQSIALHLRCTTARGLNTEGDTQ